MHTRSPLPPTHARPPHVHACLARNPFKPPTSGATPRYHLSCPPPHPYFRITRVCSQRKAAFLFHHVLLVHRPIFVCVPSHARHHICRRATSPLPRAQQQQQQQPYMPHSCAVSAHSMHPHPRTPRLASRLCRRFFALSVRPSALYQTAPFVTAPAPAHVNKHAHVRASKLRPPAARPCPSGRALGARNVCVWPRMMCKRACRCSAHDALDVLISLDVHDPSINI